MIYVFFFKKSYRRLGIARRLYDEVGRDVRDKKGVREMQLDVYHQNRNSVSFHLAIGFQHFATVFRRQIAADAAKEESEFSLRGYSGSDEDKSLLLEGFEARFGDRKAQMFLRLASSCQIVERKNKPVGCFHFRFVRVIQLSVFYLFVNSVSHEHAFGVSYGKYDYEYVFLDMALSKHKGAGRFVQQVATRTLLRV